MKKTVISVKNVTFAYPDSQEKVILNNISLDVHAGEMLVLLGPNGSGKSTLARLLNGLIQPTQGEVIVDSLNTASEQDLWEIRRRIGMVFQNPDNQLVAALVEEELAFGMENYGVPEEIMRWRIEQLSSKMQLDHLLEFPPHRLSGGQRQRVAIASVLAVEPEVLVLDEPTSMLDPSGRQEVMNELNRLKGLDKTIILVTHDMTEAVQADRVVVLGGGEIVFQGRPQACFSKGALLKEVGLEIPPAAELARRLRQKGFTIPEWVLTVEDWGDYLAANH